MVAPAQPAIHIHLPEKIEDKHVQALKELVAQLQKPVPPAPQHAKLDPKQHSEIKENVQKLTKNPHLASALEKLVKGLKMALAIVAFPAFFAGGALLLFGLSQTLFILATTLSATALLDSQALVLLLLGGILYKFGQDILSGKDLNTILGNLVYVPLPFLLRLTR